MIMGPNVIITGASSGIGKALYDGLNQLTGYECWGLSTNGPDLFYDVRELPDESIVRGPIDLLINCAGIMPFAEDKSVMDVNFWGVWNMIENLYPVMGWGGCIINIASVSGVTGEDDLPIYAASKAAVINLTKSLALKYAEHRVRVNAISPGFYKSNLTPEPAPQELLDRAPFNYEENPETLVPLVDAINKNRFMTGANIVVDGGLSL